MICYKKILWSLVENPFRIAGGGAREKQGSFTGCSGLGKRWWWRKGPGRGRRGRGGAEQGISVFSEVALSEQRKGF